VKKSKEVGSLLKLLSFNMEVLNSHIGEKIIEKERKKAKEK